ncbi:MAG: regulatory protein RecX [Gemmatimonadales bacterium]
MPTLTGLAPDPHRLEYRLVEVDRGRFASLPLDALAPLGLVVGTPLSIAMLDRLRELADVEAAARAALRALARRAHARQDLRRRLVQKQHPPPAVDRALARLAAQGLLDDRRFAREYAAARAARGRGPHRIVSDLLAQGVDRRTAETAVAAAPALEGVDPEQAARSVAEKRARQLVALPAAARKRRLTAFLLRRGFAGSTVRGLVEELCG